MPNLLTYFYGFQPGRHFPIPTKENLTTVRSSRLSILPCPPLLFSPIKIHFPWNFAELDPAQHQKSFVYLFIKDQMFFITKRRELNHDFSAKVPQYQARQTEDKKYHSWICFMCIIAVVSVACTKCDWNNSSITVKVHFGVLHKKRKLHKNQSVLKLFHLASISTYIAIMISTKPFHWFL